MASQNEPEYPPEEGTPVSHPTQPEPEQSKASQVLETMKNLIVEIQRLKEENEWLKRAQEKQQEFNEILLQILQERKNGEKPPIEVGRDTKVRDSAEINDSSSQGTQKYGNQARKTGKIKVDNLEGEFKKIKPTSFDGESDTREET